MHMQAWREHVFPLLREHLAHGVDSVIGWSLLYHETALANLLEVRGQRRANPWVCECLLAHMQFLSPLPTLISPRSGATPAGVPLPPQRVRGRQRGHATGAGGLVVQEADPPQRRRARVCGGWHEGCVRRAYRRCRETR